MPRIYVACLASYNNGALHGCWIDLDCTTVDEVNDQIAAMLRASRYPNVTVDCPECGGTGVADGCCTDCHGTGKATSAEEWAVHDYDEMPSSFGEHPSIANLVEYADALEELGDDADAFEAWWANESDFEVDLDAFRDAYAGTHANWREFAESYVDETGLLSDVPEHLARYFDFDAYGNDMRLGGDAYAVEHNGGMYFFWSR